MPSIELRKSEVSGFKKAIDYCRGWAGQHQVEIGVAEMAFGAGLIAWGVQEGLVDVGREVVGSKLEEFGAPVSAAIGGVLGPQIASTWLSSVFVGGISGVAGVTMVAAFPAIALAGAGAVVFGSFGYAATGIVSKAFTPDFSEYVKDASIAAVGLALFVDGARRVIGNDVVKMSLAEIQNGVIHLPSKVGGIIVSTPKELERLVKELKGSKVGVAAAGAGVLGGAAVGGHVAVGSVTILGSHTLGAAALSVGLVSAPVWPVIAGGAAGLAVGVAAWKGVEHLRKRKNSDDHPPLLLSAPTEE